MHPLYRKANAAYYEPEITNADRLVLEWRAAMLRESGPRRVVSHNPIPDKIIYTDAATETMIIAIVVFDKHDFDATATISEAYMEVAGGEWKSLFAPTRLIYGLELIALIQTFADPRIDIDNKSVTFYIDNNASKMALIKGDSKCLIAAISVRIFCAIVARGGITPWFDRVPTDFNIADKPTRRAKHPYRVKTARIFEFPTNLLRMVTVALEQGDNGFFDPDEIVGRYYPS